MSDAGNPPKLSRDLALIYAITITGVIGFPVITPVLPSIRDGLGISNQLVGWVMTAYALPAFLFFPLIAYLGDQYGKKWVLVPSLFLFGIAGGVTVFATTFETLIALRFLQGVGGSALVVLNVALVGDLYEGRDRSYIMGNFGMLQNVSSGIFPLIGGGLSVFAWYAPFLVFLLAIPVGLAAMTCLDNRRPATKPPALAFIGDAAVALRDPRVLQILLLSGGFIFVGFGAFVTYLPIFLRDSFGATDGLIGVIIAARVVSGGLVAWQYGRLSGYFTPRKLLAFAYILMATGMALVPVLPSAISMILIALIYGTSFAIIRPAMQVSLLDAAPENMRSSFAAAHGLALRIAQTIAPVLAGLLLLVGDLNSIYWMASAVCLLLLVVLLTAKQWDAQNEVET